MTQQDALRKAMACLRLANSTNEHEAALAAARAQEIITRYQLNINDVDFDASDAQRDTETVHDFGYEDPIEQAKYFKPWMLRLASVAARANQCRVVYIKCNLDDISITASPSSKPRGAKVKVIGRPSDVQAARYMHGLLKGEVVRISNERCAGHSGTFTRQFRLGMVETIGVRLQEQRKATFDAVRSEQTNQMALVKVNSAIAKLERHSADVDAFLKGLSLKNGTMRGTARTSLGADARALGRVAGRDVRISSAKGGIGAGRKEIA